MKTIPLKRFKYVIPDAPIAHGKTDEHNPADEQLPLMKVDLDFEAELLKVEGDWTFLTSISKHYDMHSYRHHLERVSIETVIYPGGHLINQYVPGSGRPVFALEGSIRENDTFNPCSGLLVIDSVKGYNNHVTDQWNLTFYLYDLLCEGCEIKFMLPVFTTKALNINN